jgi:hypothetical protein
MPLIQQNILQDDCNGQAVTHIQESVAMIRISVHLAGEESDQHIIRLASRVSRMITVCEVPTKLKSRLCSQDEVLAPNDCPAWPSS